MNLKDIKFPTILPILIEDNSFIYPYTISPIFINDEANMNAINLALEENSVIFITTTKDNLEDSVPFYDVGVVGNIMRKQTIPNGKTKILFQGISRARIIKHENEKPLIGMIELILPDNPDMAKLNAAMVFLNEKVDLLSKLLPYFPHDLMKTIENYEPNRIIDTILSTIKVSKNKVYSVYSNSNTIERLILLISYIDEEIESLKLQKEIKTKVNSKVEKINREFYLKEQLKQIQRELGVDSQKNEEIEVYYKKLDSIKSHINEDAYKEIKKQIDRLSRMHQDSSESNITQNYIEWMLEIPFGKFSNKKLSIANVEKQLSIDHYSLEKPKERIVEFFAVKELLLLRGKKDANSKGTILCFYGPPGVGKTSLANSIAKALKRSLIRIALGGLEDVNELRGHRRTYLGAMPGRIIQGLIDAKEMNPVVVLDEIDKVGRSYRGDPTSVLLEILDPEQNIAFRDYYANFNIDLSQIIFIATANDIAQIPAPLRDRMEFIQLNSYTPQEKLEIAKKYLIPQELKKHGILNTEFSINTNALKEVIEKYTREAGVRKLREQIAQIMRKSAKMILENNKSKITINTQNLKYFLNKSIFEIEESSGIDKVGVVNGLAWTSVGGDVLKIEAIKIAGKGTLEITGNLGDVMKESAKIALSVSKNYVDKKFKTKEQIYNRYNIHIHVPEGATPKDGPSAGIGLALAIMSVFLDKKVDSKIAMTGELTLSGDVLAIGGLKEKLIAAFKAKMEIVLIPEKNYKRDLDEIPKEVKDNLKIIPITRIEEVFKRALK
ncbi:endopeptidase La [Helicobacter sp. MIT 14-3879]|uniref:endopeptidase La n=1 Tax=Helicobacter sp. MIT 14-3879 TaxID=2040649 RepID=UPI000E1E30DB|nr:endopeptidase La [Helicobacter sp. MIT 14-3879]RDU65574.1 endopeptidase La [Helicobacter sp. MIT 14-3879]